MKPALVYSLAFTLLALVTVARVDAADCPDPTMMDEALALVMGAHPVLVAEYDEYQEETRTKDWDAYVRVGYALESTDTDAAGPNASIQVKIPLFSGKKKRLIAKARTAWMKSQDSVRSAFLSDLDQLCAKLTTAKEMKTMVAFYRERMEYTIEKDKAGERVPEDVWDSTEKTQKTIHDHEEAMGKVSALRHTIARQYGGGRWQELLGMLPR